MPISPPSTHCAVCPPPFPHSPHCVPRPTPTRQARYADLLCIRLDSLSGWGVNGSMVTLLPDTPLPEATLLQPPPPLLAASSSSSGLSAGAVVGVVVGSVCGAALLIGGLALLLLLLRRRRCVCGQGGAGWLVGGLVG